MSSPLPLRERLWDAQDGLCWICRKPMDRDERPNHPLAPTIDHILPLSKGGKNAPDNKLLAHGQCNWKRKNAVPVVTQRTALMLLRYEEISNE